MGLAIVACQGRKFVAEVLTEFEMIWSTKCFLVLLLVSLHQVHPFAIDDVPEEELVAEQTVHVVADEAVAEKELEQNDNEYGDSEDTPPWLEDIEAEQSADVVADEVAEESELKQYDNEDGDSEDTPPLNQLPPDIRFLKDIQEEQLNDPAKAAKKKPAKKAAPKKAAKRKPAKKVAKKVPKKAPPKAKPQKAQAGKTPKKDTLPSAATDEDVQEEQLNDPAKAAKKAPAKKSAPKKAATKVPKKAPPKAKPKRIAKKMSPKIDTLPKGATDEELPVIVIDPWESANRPTSSPTTKKHPTTKAPLNQTIAFTTKASHNATFNDETYEEVELERRGRITECVSLTVGSSGHNTRTVTLDSKYKCPTTVNKQNWL